MRSPALQAVPLARRFQACQGDLPTENGHYVDYPQLAVKHRLAKTAPVREYAEAGYLMAYGPSLMDQYKIGAKFVDRILKGAKPADLPVEQPTKFELIINLKTAKALRLTIPPSVLGRADQIVE